MVFKVLKINKGIFIALLAAIAIISASWYERESGESEHGGVQSPVCNCRGAVSGKCGFKCKKKTCRHTNRGCGVTGRRKCNRLCS